MYHYRTPLEQDVIGIYNIINYYHKKGVMLLKSNLDISKDLEHFIVCYLDNKKKLSNIHDENQTKNQVIGCGYLHVYSNSLVEIRSLGVLPNFQQMGIGKKIMEKLLFFAKKKYDRIFLLTKEEKFFQRVGFKLCNMNDLPEKIYKDCSHCPSYPICEEKAMIYG